MHVTESGESMEKQEKRLKIWISHLTDSLFMAKLMQNKLSSTELYTLLKKTRQTEELSGGNVLAGSILIARHTQITEDVGA